MITNFITSICAYIAAFTAKFLWQTINHNITYHKNQASSENNLHCHSYIVQQLGMKAISIA